jgi:malonyl CoA-acyl carrier protein transacylase
MAFTRALERKHGVPIASTASLILGHSSGEYTSAVAAGALSLGDGVRLTRLHGLLTHFALSLPSIGLSPEVSSPPAVRGGMSALVLNPGHTHQELTEVIRRIRAERPKQRGSEGTVEVASFNSLTQVVLAGSRDGILRASEVLKELEIANRAADLPVSCVFLPLLTHFSFPDAFLLL